MRANYRHLYADVAWYGILAGSTVAFLNVYAARLGASSFAISMLSAGPAVVNLLFSLPAGRWLEKHALIPTTARSAFLHRLGYTALIPLPWLLSGQSEILAIILITLLMSVPGTVLAISFNAVFAQVAPPEVRGELVGRRNALLAVTMTLTTLACGQILDRVQPFFNYQIIFIIGMLGGLMSTYHLSRLQASGTSPAAGNGTPIGNLARPGLIRFADSFRVPVGLRFLTRARGEPLLRLDLLRSSFGRLLFAYLIFYACQFIPIPLFPLFLVNDLALSDSAISLGNGLFYLIVFLASLRLAGTSARYTYRFLSITGAMGYALYPLVLGLARDAALFWIASVLGGVAWALASSGLINHLMECTPEDDRPAHMALHNLALNLGILAGSLLGPGLGAWIGLRDALLLSGALRLLAAFTLLRWI